MKRIALLIALVCCLPVHADKPRDQFELILTSLNYCYENENKLGVELAQCLLTQLKKYKNPEGYKVSVTDDNPSKSIPSNLVLTISNQYGQVFICKGIAEKKIDIKSCTGKKVSPKTPAAQTSISPPS